MQRTVFAAVFASLALLIWAAAATAKVVAPAPIPDRVALADVVILGKVTAIEDKTVSARRYPGANEKTEYRIALVQVQDLLKGPRGVTTIRLGFVPPPVVPPPKPGIVVSGGPHRFPQMNHTVGQEACFFLTKHFEGDFHVAQMYYEVVEKKAPNFDKDLALVKRCAKLLEDPRAGLKAKDAEDRLMTAAMLLTRYRTPKPGQINPKTEPIDAEENRLILQAIVSGDWSRKEFGQLSPQLLIGRLGLTAKDGWNPPKFKDYQKEFPAYAQKWLKDHLDTYRIQRFVP
jgi:hypothetical protein